MSDYFDLRADLFRRAFDAGLDYEGHVAAANARERAAWARTEAATPPVPEELRERLDARGRRLNVLVLSATWCGDCIRSVPILHAVARAAGGDVRVRILERDQIPSVRDELRILGAMRIPVAVFLTEDFHEIGRFGDRPLVVYRDKAVRELGAACPVPGAEDADALRVEMREWVDLFERMILMARLCPPLRARHRD